MASSNTAEQQIDLIATALSISAKAQQIIESLRSRRLPTPTLNASAGSTNVFDYIPLDDAKLQASRAELVVQARMLADVFAGPSKVLFEQIVFGHHNAMTLRVIYTYQIPKHVPLEGSISFEDLSAACGIARDKLERVARYAILNRIFTEPSPGRLAHSAVSKLLATEQMTMDFLGHNTEDIFPASVNQIETMRVPGDDIYECGFNHTFREKPDDKVTFFEYLTAHPERAKRFGGAMGFVTAPGTHGSADNLLVGYDWAGKGAAKVVDVGGSIGHTAARVIEYAPQLSSVTVQDLPDVIQNAEVRRQQASGAGFSSEKLHFQAASFFDPQPIKDADVYLYRFIFHDWPRDKALDILKNLIPSMKSGAELVINDFILFPSTGGGGNDFSDKVARAADMQMMVGMNARERSLEDWKDLVEEVAGSEMQLVSARPFVLAFRKV